MTKEKSQSVRAIMFSFFQRAFFLPLHDAGSLESQGTVIDLAGVGGPYREQALTRYDLWTADECFLTGTAAEVIPCVEVDHGRSETVSRAK